MELLLYFKTVDQNTARFQQRFTAGLTGQTLKVIHSIEQLTDRFRRPFTCRGATVAVLFPADQRDLADLVAIKDLLEGLRIILVLPDSYKETISAGHRLRPRYITFAGGNLDDVISVLEKISVKSITHFEN